jgi:predicted RNA-binding protein associated with RNAse of E/G family
MEHGSSVSYSKPFIIHYFRPPDRSSITVLDEDEFREAVAKGWLTGEEAGKARAELRRLIKLFNQGHFPPKLLERFA